ncbi:epoxide hydrolase family protein [Jidongwangia harbinensis]|uniref:epoxide hydrolase family protein n=1 Tax=Jidongwangia harbinensis TaxID=2878561 RepID=UPI001CDA3432|nr:epoxide hydrolase family protein [Jidongwangia harbinensis]MCA2211278.1 epoxide hydrolase [Jidongwangia harbinensis]
MTVSPFRIDVSDEVLDDLRTRLARTRFTDRTGDRPWQAGVDPDYLRDLVSYWAERFDWRAREAELNALPQFQVRIGGRRMHFLHLPGTRPAGAPAPLPLLLSHGWPSSFVEMLPLADRLTDPARYGSDPADSFDVVVPSLPGFLYSELPEGPLTWASMARTLHLLMTEVLGCPRYGAFGGDVGGVVTGWLGALYPEQVTGIHLIHPPLPARFDSHPISVAEQAHLDALAAYDETDGGYSAIMETRPDTIAAALTDSPAGLAAWLVDKYRDWSDNHGDLESRFDRDTLLTIITLYWTSGAIGSSFRQYVDAGRNSARPDITVPAAFTVSAEPACAGRPREMAERACTDVRHWSEPGRGGHFMPLEEPDLLAAELRRFFTSLRAD